MRHPNREFSCVVGIFVLAAPVLGGPASDGSFKSSLSFEATIQAFCRDIVRLTKPDDFEAKPSPDQIHALRLQAESLLKVSQRQLPTDHPALALLEAALGTLLCADGQEAPGTIAFTQGSRKLALRLRERRIALGPQHLDLVPELATMGRLYELAGLRSAQWRDEALEIRDHAATKPDPALEGEQAAAIEDRYGPWLTVAETEPMLNLCGLLARRWLADCRMPQRTERILRLGLKPDAERVWALAARKGSESLRRDLEALLAELDTDQVLNQGALPTLCKLAERLQATPLEPASLRLIQRLEKQGRKRLSLAQRRQLFQMMGDADEACALLEKELDAATTAAQLPLLNEALPLLEQAPRNALLMKGSTWLLERADQAIRTASIPKELPDLMQRWAARLDAGDHKAEGQRMREQINQLGNPSAEKPTEEPWTEEVGSGPDAAFRLRLRKLSRKPILSELDALLEEVERLRSPNHPLVAEILMERSHLNTDHSLADAQRAARILETSENLDLRIEAMSQVVECCSRDGNGHELERAIWDLGTLMQTPALADPRYDETRKNMVISLILYLWREQRPGEIEQLPAILQTGIEKELEPVRDRLRRTTRLQGLLRAQGLP
jgi:hypothetical protein